jgi:hypothetical protein
VFESKGKKDMTSSTAAEPAPGATSEPAPEQLYVISFALARPGSRSMSMHYTRTTSLDAALGRAHQGLAQLKPGFLVTQTIWVCPDTGEGGEI